MRRRCVFALSAFLISWLPVILTYSLTVALVSSRRFASGPSTTPNPAPWPFLLGPNEVLVYIEPWFAGTILFWWLFWVPAILLWSLATAYLGSPINSKPASNVLRRLIIVVSLSALLGVIFASPWLYALAKVSAR
jgi:hypothetical protein